MQFQAADFGNEPVTQANSHHVSDSAEFFLAIFLSLILVWGCFCKTPCDTLPPGLILTAYQTKKPRSSSHCTFSPIRCENDASCWAVNAVQSAASSFCSSPLTGQNFKTENQESSFYLSTQEKVHLCSWLNSRHTPTERDSKERNWGKIFCTFSF